MTEYIPLCLGVRGGGERAGGGQQTAAGDGLPCWSSGNEYIFYFVTCV